MVKAVPPDPDGENDNRAEWAERGLMAFARATGCDREDMVHDMLADIRHWCDRNNMDWDIALTRAMSAYDGETLGDEPPAAPTPPVLPVGVHALSAKLEALTKTLQCLRFTRDSLEIANSLASPVESIVMLHALSDLAQCTNMLKRLETAIKGD